MIDICESSRTFRCNQIISITILFNFRIVDISLYILCTNFNFLNKFTLLISHRT